MGCCGSTTAESPVPEQRRRLSISKIGLQETQSTATEESLTEEERGFLHEMEPEDIMRMLKEKTDSNGRKFSLGSEQDAGMMPFGNKKTGTAGDKVDPKKWGLGYTCRKGLKPESPNQDSWCVLKVDTRFSLYGVFDGHGKHGHHVSNLVKATLPKLIMRDDRFMTDRDSELMPDVFNKMQGIVGAADKMHKISALLSGTTATIAVHDHTTNRLTLAHVADSTAVIGYYKGGSLVGQALTRDHKPDLKDERQRIEKHGGQVIFDGYANHRVYVKSKRHPGLNMSRCIGDILGHEECGISAEPEVTVRDVTEHDYVLLLCSDGVWEFISPQEAVDFVAKFGPDTAMNAADTLAKEAWDRWIKEEGGTVVDDITVVVSFFQHNGATHVGTAEASIS